MYVSPHPCENVPPHERRVPLVQLRHSAGVTLTDTVNQLLVGWQIGADSSLLTYSRFSEHKSLTDQGKHAVHSMVWKSREQPAFYQAARQSGRRIPAELALVGFDDLDVVAHLDVPLTTVAQDAFQIGQLAAELLVRRLRGEAEIRLRLHGPTTTVRAGRHYRLLVLKLQKALMQ